MVFQTTWTESLGERLTHPWARPKSRLLLLWTQNPEIPDHPHPQQPPDLIYTCIPDPSLSPAFCVRSTSPWANLGFLNCHLVAKAENNISAHLCPEKSVQALGGVPMLGLGWEGEYALHSLPGKAPSVASVLSQGLIFTHSFSHSFNRLNAHSMLRHQWQELGRYTL